MSASVHIEADLSVIYVNFRFTSHTVELAHTQNSSRMENWKDIDGSMLAHIRIACHLCITELSDLSIIPTNLQAKLATIAEAYLTSKK